MSENEQRFSRGDVARAVWHAAGKSERFSVSTYKRHVERVGRVVEAEHPEGFQSRNGNQRIYWSPAELVYVIDGLIAEVESAPEKHPRLNVNFQMQGINTETLVYALAHLTQPE